MPVSASRSIVNWLICATTLPASLTANGHGHMTALAALIGKKGEDRSGHGNYVVTVFANDGRGLSGSCGGDHH